MSTNGNGTKRKESGETNGKRLFDFPTPGLDLEAAMASHRKTLAALADVNQLALTGAQEVHRRLAEQMQHTVAGLTSMVMELAQPSALSAEWVQKQADSSKEAVAKGLAEARDLAVLIAKTNTEAFGILSKRMSEGIGEVRARS